MNFVFRLIPYLSSPCILTGNLADIIMGLQGCKGRGAVKSQLTLRERPFVGRQNELFISMSHFNDIFYFRKMAQ